MPILRRSVVQFCSAPLVRFHTALDILRMAVRQDAHEQVFTWHVGAALTGYFLQDLFLFDTSANCAPVHPFKGVRCERRGYV